MNNNDERDYAEEAANVSDTQDEHRSEHGMRVTLNIEWERANYSDGFFAQKFAEELRDALVLVAELAVGFQPNSIVTSNIEKLGG